MKDYFGGWYFRVTANGESIAFIAAVHRSGGVETASLQIVCKDNNHTVEFYRGSFFVDVERPHAKLGNCVFSEKGILLDVTTPDLRVRGKLRFGAATPIVCDIMGPFRFVPMLECRHSVYSMAHEVDGCVIINSEKHVFDHGLGYIEGDRGRSFPSKYVWSQSFIPGGSVMLSVALIPIGPVEFPGVISVIMLDGVEFRLATYLGAKAVMIEDRDILIKQGRLALSARFLEDGGRMLNAPMSGDMSRLICENISCRAEYVLKYDDETIVEYVSNNAAFEFEW